MEQLLINCHIPDDERNSFKDMLHHKQILDEHREVNRRQRQAFSKMKESLEKNVLLILIDFKQNIELGHGPIENQDVWRTKVQNTVLGMVLWLNGEKYYVDFVSRVLSHTSDVVIGCLEQLFKEKWLCYEKIIKIHFWMDCAPYFRCSH